MPRRRDCACDCDAVRCAVTNDALCERASPLSPHDNGTDVRTERRQPQAERRRSRMGVVTSRGRRDDAPQRAGPLERSGIPNDSEELASFSQNASP